MIEFRKEYSSAQRSLSLFGVAVGAVLLLTIVAGFFGPVPGQTSIVQNAYAHQDPADCTDNPSAISIRVLRGGVPISTVATVYQGETLQAQAQLFEGPTDVFCAYEAGTLNIFNPDGSGGVTNPPPEVPCIGGTTDTGDIINDPDCGDANTLFTGNAGADYVVNCEDEVLRPNDSFQLLWTADYAGLLHDGTSDDTPMSADTQTDNPCQVPHTTLTKTHAADDDDTPDVFEVGDTIHYTVTETNDGEAPLNNPTITDSFQGVLDDECDGGDGADPAVFEVGEVITCTYDRTVTLEDCDGIHNEVTSVTEVVGQPQVPVDDEFAEDDVTVSCPPHTTLTKTHAADDDDTPDVFEVGDTIHYTVTETNDGAVDLNNPTITDSFQGVLDDECDGGDGSDPAVFEVGETITCTYDRTVTTEDCGLTLHNEVTSVTTTLNEDPVDDEFAEDDVNVQACGEEGCTPGFWKVPQHHDSWTTYTPGTLIGDVFDGESASLSSKTFLEALSFKGSSTIQGAEQILLRAAVASLLNAESPDVDFPRTSAEIIADVNAALASDDRETILDLATELDNDNNLGCDLS